MCVRQIDGVLTRMRSRYDLRGGSAAMERVDELLAALLSRPIDAVLRDGLHQYLDWIQLQLSIITTEIAQAFFGVQPPLAVQSQSQ